MACQRRRFQSSQAHGGNFHNACCRPPGSKSGASPQARVQNVAEAPSIAAPQRHCGGAAPQANSSRMREYFQFNAAQPPSGRMPRGSAAIKIVRYLDCIFPKYTWTRSTVRTVRAASDRQVEGSKPSEPFFLTCQGLHAQSNACPGIMQNHAPQQPMQSVPMITQLSEPGANQSAS